MRTFLTIAYFLSGYIQQSKTLLPDNDSQRKYSTYNPKDLQKTCFVVITYCGLQVVRYKTQKVNSNRKSCICISLVSIAESL